MRGFFCTSLRISAPIWRLSGWLKLPQNPLQKFFSLRQGASSLAFALI